MKQIGKQLLVSLLTFQAKAVLKKYKPRIIAVTGSVGKTSTKDAIYSVIAPGTHVRRSEKSFNSEIGIPLTILGLSNAWGNPLKWLQNLFEGFLMMFVETQYPKWLVLEVGADRPGDIARVASWLRVEVAVITRLPEVPVHVEFFDGPQEVVEEKAALIRALQPHGTLVLYGDDERTRALKARAGEGVATLFFGLSNTNDVRAEGFTLLREEGGHTFPLGMSAALSIGTQSAPIVVLGTVGEHALLPAVAAAAVGRAVGKDLGQILEGLNGYTPPAGRMHLVRGVKETLIIDDSYNASPVAVLAALDTLALCAKKVKGRTIAVLGDMTELGRHSIAQHKMVGERAAKVADILVTVGFRARGIAEGALDAGLPDAQILQFEDSYKAGDELDDIVMPGDIVLVKGSQVTRMERVIEEIMAEPERSEELLVRQDAEWKKR